VGDPDRAAGPLDRPRARQVLQRVALEPAAPREVDQVGELVRCACVLATGERAFEPDALHFAHPAHQMKAQAQRAVGIHEAPPLTFVHRDGLDGHAVAARVVDQHFS